ncbi:MAG: SMC-Scp complex subunit ScpB [Propionibacteriaceae bacterium]|nr:SMC-Scp complex subunit ScpB [Propionibacteriaceae bacterium]
MTATPDIDVTEDDETPTATPEQIAPQLEALLLMAEEAVPSSVLAEAVGAPVPVVEQALSDLVDTYDNTGRGFMLRCIGGGWRYATRPTHHELLSRWVVEGQVNRLTQAGLETLAVIAYLQPVSRARVSAVRGVNVDTAVRTLLARDLITEDGQDDQTGAALLRTTDYFLERVGLGGLDELPPIAPRLPEAAVLEAELAALTAESETAAPEGEETTDE